MSEEPKFKKDLGLEDIDMNWEEPFISKDFFQSLKIFSLERKKKKKFK